MRVTHVQDHGLAEAPGESELAANEDAWTSGGDRLRKKSSPISPSATTLGESRASSSSAA